MPICRYQPVPSPCRICGEGFEHSQRPNEPDLDECPTCGKKVTKLLPSGIGIPRVARKPSISEAKQAGFTVLKKIGQGEYEKQ